MLKGPLLESAAFILRALVGSYRRRIAARQQPEQDLCSLKNENLIERWFLHQEVRISQSDAALSI